MTTDLEPITPITLACLDMAGTTVRDDGAVIRAFLSALTAVGVDADDPRQPEMVSYVRETMGQSKIAVFTAMFGEEPGRPQAANAAFEDAYSKLVANGEVEPMTGAAEVIRSLRDRGVKVALTTGFSAATRDQLVDALGWSEMADLFVSPEDAGRGRPYPDMVLMAIIKLGIDDVASVAVVGDTAADITTGLRAGASIVAGVLTGADDAPRLRAAGATDLLASIVDLPGLIDRA